MDKLVVRTELHYLMFLVKMTMRDRKLFTLEMSNHPFSHRQKLLYFIILTASIIMLSSYSGLLGLISTSRNDSGNAGAVESAPDQPAAAVMPFSSQTTSTTVIPNKIIHPAECSEARKQVIQKTVAGPMKLMRLTSCPDSDAWLKDYLDIAADNENRFTFLNFGCNKGFDSLRVARVVTKNDKVFSKEKWREAIGISNTGACNQGSGLDVPILLNNNRASGQGTVSRNIEVHCVEAMPSNYNRLEYAAENTTANKYGLNVHLYAMTGSPGGGAIFFPNSAPGTENMGLDSCNKSPRLRKSCVSVPAITVDEFVAKHVSSIQLLKEKNNNVVAAPIAMNKDNRLPYVSIDVEGFDYTIMKAAPKTLQQTDYLEFEFHSQGDWANQNLTECISMLEDFGLVCYWTGVSKLWRISKCWVDAYKKFHGWSNIACVNVHHQVELFEKMEQVFEGTVGNTP